MASYFVKLCLCIVLIIQLVYAEEAKPSENKLSVFQQRGGNYIKRGEIVDIPHAPKYVATLADAVEPVENPDDLYKVKIRDERTQKIMMTSIKFCQLIGSNWEDEFQLHLDANNEVYHVDYFAGDVCEKTNKTPSKPFSTKVTVAGVAKAPTPELNQATTKKQSTTSTRRPAKNLQEGIEEVEAEKTFFQKYWYILIGVAFVLLSSGGPPASDQAPARR
ncbi:uncharacterized protein BYT42DRAFT_577027 [Radiomyces spectabilis]|uniref:uncharacterized protein n=1 Tax=Radiomyces spectabilis TaxID=64574 RepID=UPI002220468D|nr:uncharacterized protein BYT42DRAFT_577027 [Radiomyces spectabilis]KAI8374617.1 hypothetical protein BYT42DRAFT_577027 [Radiomyces spectabilis]